MNTVVQEVKQTLKQDFYLIVDILLQQSRLKVSFYCVLSGAKKKRRTNGSVRTGLDPSVLIDFRRIIRKGFLVSVVMKETLWVVKLSHRRSSTVCWFVLTYRDDVKAQSSATD